MRFAQYLVVILLTAYVSHCALTALRNAIKPNNSSELVVSFLIRIITEVIQQDAAALTDVVYINFYEDEYKDLLQMVNCQLEDRMYPTFVSSRNAQSKNRAMVVVAWSPMENMLDEFFQYFNGSTNLQRLENNQRVFCVLIVIGHTPTKDQLLAMVSHSKSFNLFAIIIPEDSSSSLLGKRLSGSPAVLNQSELLENIFPDILKQFTGNITVYLDAIKLTPFVMLTDGKLHGQDVLTFEVILDHMGLKHDIRLISTENPRNTIEEIKKDFISTRIAAFVNRGGFNAGFIVNMILPETDGICLLVPKAQKILLIRHLLQSFETDTWIFIGLFLVLCTLLNTLLPNHFRKNLILEIFCGFTTYSGPLKLVEEFFTLGSSALFLVIMEAFLTKLIAYLVGDQYEPDPQTIDEFMQSSITLVIHSIITDSIDFDSFKPGMSKKMIVLEHMNVNMSNNTYGYVVKCSAAKVLLLELARYKYKTTGTVVRPTFHMIPEKLSITKFCYSWAPGAVIYSRFELYATWLFECGLMDYWRLEVERKYYTDERMVFDLDDYLDFAKLNNVWIIYGGGMSLAIVSFCLEYLYHSFSRKIKNKPAVAKI